MIRNLLLSILILLVCIACDKNDDNDSKKGILKINNRELTIDKALVMNWGEYNGMDESYEGKRLILGLFSPEVELIEVNGEIDSMSGVGHGVQFELFVENPQNITDQNFIFSSEYKINTLSMGAFFIDFPFSTGAFIDGNFVTDGAFNLSADKELLKLSANFNLQGGETASLEYNGGYLFLQPPPED